MKSLGAMEFFRKHRKVIILILTVMFVTWMIGATVLIPVLFN